MELCNVTQPKRCQKTGNWQILLNFLFNFDSSDERAIG